MYFDLSDEQLALQDTARRFARDRIAPVAAEYDQSGDFPREILAEALEQIPETAEVHVHIGALAYIDHACAELLHGQQERRERAGGQLHTEWDEVQRLREQKPLVKRGASSQAA